MNNLNANDEKVMRMWGSLFTWKARAGECAYCGTPALLFDTISKHYYCSKECAEKHGEETES